MNYKYSYIFLFLLNFLGYSLSADNLTLLKDSGTKEKSGSVNFVLSSISKNNVNQIKIKWYSSSLIYPEGVNIYRKETGESSWQKLNSSPFKKGNYSPSAEELKQDKELKQYISLIGSAKIEGVALLGAYVKTFKSEAFSKYIGIQFTDNTIGANKTVHYKVCSINGSSETEIGISEPVLSGKASPLLPPSEIDIVAKNKKATVKWLPETSRYFAVDIYRMFDSTGSDRKKSPKILSLFLKIKIRMVCTVIPSSFILMNS